MVVGFNHNFRYRDRVFHIQTEDGGVRSPHITTLVYCGGTILASKKTSYADITRVSNLEQVVEDLMKEQHKEMLRRLRDGDFDDKIDAMIGGAGPASPSPAPGPAVEPEAKPAPKPEPRRPVTPVRTRPVASPARQPARTPQPPASAPVPEPTPAPKPKAPEPRPEPQKEPEVPALDDIILSYLVGDDDK
ncbi:MAG: hypothetical protein D6751_08385 [Deltaproteobacteria bacterium]|nr:MAG: hypothetical protein D6751_08385 [Deltaproteobacteria bacterium]